MSGVQGLGVRGTGIKGLGVQGTGVQGSNGIDTTPPILVGQPVIPANGLTVTLTYNEALDAASTPATGDFVLVGTASTVSSVNVTGSTVVLTLNTAVGFSDIVTLSYTAGVAPIQDLAGNQAVNLVNQAVTNNSADLLTTGGSVLQVSGVDLRNA